MKRPRGQCVERHGEFAKKSASHLKKVRTPCVDDYHLKRQDFEAVGDLALGCAQIALKCVCCARIYWADILL